MQDGVYTSIPNHRISTGMQNNQTSQNKIISSTGRRWRLEVCQHPSYLHLGTEEYQVPPRYPPQAYGIRMGDEYSMQRKIMKQGKECMKKHMLLTCHNCSNRNNKKSITTTKQNSLPAQAPHERYLVNKLRPSTTTEITRWVLTD